MIDITDGFTSISAGADPIAPPLGRDTGARVTVEFCRDEALAPGQLVTVRYEFAGDGRLRTATGIAKPIRTVVRQGRGVVYHYRTSHWIEPDAVMDHVACNVRQRGEPGETPPQRCQQA